MFLGQPPRIAVPGIEGAYVHVGSTINNTVVFLGYADKLAPGGIRCIGTGFLIGKGNVGYLCTVRHVAIQLDNVPFVIRLNRKDGRAELIQVDNRRWTYPSDPTVDLAAMLFHLNTESIYDISYITEPSFLDEKFVLSHEVDVGEICYTVGLFRFIYGDQKNFPLVHSGNIALMPPPGERIPIWDSTLNTKQMVEGYLIESRAIDGASGSPVFVRRTFRPDPNIPEFQFRNRPGDVPINPILAESRVHLLGVFQGAWFAPPDPNLPIQSRAKGGNIVPVGVGIVIPNSKILDLLEDPFLKKYRTDKARQEAATQLAVSQAPEPPTKADNPQHKEAFMRLVSEAAKKPRPTE